MNEFSTLFVAIRYILDMCYSFSPQVMFDDSNKDGQMLVDLTADLMELTCKGNYSNHGLYNPYCEKKYP